MGIVSKLGVRWDLWNAQGWKPQQQGSCTLNLINLIYAGTSPPACLLLCFGGRCSVLAGGEIKLRCQGQAVWKCKTEAASRAGISKVLLLYSERSLEMTTTTWCHLATSQRLELRQKKGFREENRAEEPPTTPKWFGEWMSHQGEVTAVGWWLPLPWKFSPFWGLAQKEKIIFAFQPPALLFLCLWWRGALSLQESTAWEHPEPWNW